ncbi:MAG TPA: trehalose-phosphatase [Verrucomicrobiae bacterium]|nr:trehalose-phosphatase [Verrucomicrobiae bacterium]
MLHLEAQDISSDSHARLTHFFERLAHAPARALILDYDGTLAPFSPERHRALPYPAVPPLLDRIRDRDDTRLVFVTGRRAYEVAALLGMKHLEVWGCHGFSRLLPDGTYCSPKLNEEKVRRMARANELLVNEGLFDLLEFKPASTAIHWRGFEAGANQVARKVERIWATLPTREGLRLLEFDGGMEIRVEGFDKGDAVRTILSEVSRDAAVAYLGDDHTDEDAFAALQGYGLSVRVGKDRRPTVADIWIRPPEGLIAFLADWIAIRGGAS